MTSTDVVIGGKTLAKHTGSVRARSPALGRSRLARPTEGQPSPLGNISARTELTGAARPDQIPRMATSASTAQLTDLHMLVLVALAAHGAADAEEVAAWLGLPV